MAVIPNPLGLLRRFSASIIGNAGAYAMGAATADSLRPELQDLVNFAWSNHPHRPPDVGTLALGVAQGQVNAAQAAAWAKEHGFGQAQFDALVNVANTGPGVPVAFDLWRRNKIDEDGFRRAAKRQGLEQEWIEDLVKIKLAVLDPGQLANAIHRGLIPDPGLLLGHTPGPGKVPAYPVYNIDALAEALANGYDHDHLGVLVGLTGLPMGSHEAAQATFRGVIDKEDFYRAIAEGNTRNEWADALFDQSRAIPSPTNYIESYIRGWRTLDEMYAGAARQGMSQEDATLLQLIHGRAPTAHQVFIGKRRGGERRGPPVQPDTLWPEIDLDFLQALRESNIRPEWYGILWAQRFTYPSTFILRAMAQAGDLTPDETKTILLYEGWEPTLATTVANRWTGGGGATAATADPWVKRAQTQLWTAAHRAYVNFDATETQARSDLAALGIAGTAQDDVIALWNQERALVRRDLAATDIKKEFYGQLITHDQAVARLVELGYSQEDATEYLLLAPK